MRIACNQCDYARRAIASITVAIKADGSEVVCPHPIEFTRAEEATGLSWRELKRAGRIRYRYAMVCLGCGELDYYGPDQLGTGPRQPTHIGSIVRKIRRREAGMHRCRACGLNTLQPLHLDETEWEILVEFWNWIRGKPNGPICPSCHLGRLRSDMVAIS